MCRCSDGVADMAALAGTNKIDRKTLVERAAAAYARDQRRL